MLFELKFGGETIFIPTSSKQVEKYSRFQLFKALTRTPYKLKLIRTINNKDL